MKLIYTKEEVREQCTSAKVAKKLFGGNVDLVLKLFSSVQALESAETIKDIIVQPAFRFHNLKNKKGRNLEGWFAIDIKKREPWRIVLRPLDEKEEPYNPCEIDKIAAEVHVVEIMEISNHYE